MLIKIIGGLLVLISCSFIGVKFSMKESYRIDDLLAMKKALLVLKSEIQYAINPLPEALLNVANRTSKEVSIFFQTLSGTLSDGALCGLSDAWADTMGKTLSETYLTEADLSSLSQLGKTLGHMDKEVQLANIEISIGYIDDVVEKLRQGVDVNKKMYRSLGIISGFIITIIFL